VFDQIKNQQHIEKKNVLKCEQLLTRVVALLFKLPDAKIQIHRNTKYLNV